MMLLFEVYTKTPTYCCDDNDDCRIDAFRELETCGFVVCEKVTTHAYDDTYCLSLTDEGTKLVENYVEQELGSHDLFATKKDENK